MRDRADEDEDSIEHHFAETDQGSLRSWALVILRYTAVLVAVLIKPLYSAKR
jgi:hypothetical protein